MSATLWVGAQGNRDLQGCHIKKKAFSLKLWEWCVCDCVCLGMHVLQWATLPGQALAGMGLVSSPGHWLGGWPSLSSCVWAGCPCFVMEMLFPSNPWIWQEGQHLPGPVKRKWFNSRAGLWLYICTKISLHTYYYVSILLDGLNSILYRRSQSPEDEFYDLPVYDLLNFPSVTIKVVSLTSYLAP